MLVNSIKHANLTIACILTVRNSSYFSLTQLLHGCRQFLFYNIWLIPIKNETFVVSCKREL